MTDTEQRTAAKAFAERWKGRGYEKGESQVFWLELLQTVYGVENPILDARALYPDSSLADLYDELTMPPELRRAHQQHQQNDRAVMQAYGFSVKDTTESSCVAELMKLYQRMTAGN